MIIFFVVLSVIVLIAVFAFIYFNKITAPTIVALAIFLVLVFFVIYNLDSIKELYVDSHGNKVSFKLTGQINEAKDLIASMNRLNEEMTRQKTDISQLIIDSKSNEQKYAEQKQKIATFNNQFQTQKHEIEAFNIKFKSQKDYLNEALNKLEDLEDFVDSNDTLMVRPEKPILLINKLRRIKPPIPENNINKIVSELEIAGIIINCELSPSVDVTNKNFDIKLSNDFLKYKTAVIKALKKMKPYHPTVP